MVESSPSPVSLASLFVFAGLSLGSSNYKGGKGGLGGKRPPHYWPEGRVRYKDTMKTIWAQYEYTALP